MNHSKKNKKANKVNKINKKTFKKLDRLSPFELKDKLTKLTKSEKLNAGRGNTNFLNTFVREVFAHLQLLATDSTKEFGFDQGLIPILSDANYKKVLLDGCKKWKPEYAKFFKQYISYVEKRALAANKDINKIMLDIIVSTLGCYYPKPPQIQPHIELVAEDFLYDMVMSSVKKNEPGAKMTPSDFECFATEGAASAILYVFNTLKENYLLKPGDTVAVLTPVFSPYLEMPKLADYDLKIIELKGNQSMNWSLHNDEIDKIKNKKIKALFMVNPTNPGAYSLSRQNIERISRIVNNERKDLIVVSDSVYAPFTDEFNSFMMMCPENTIEIFSLSKYFGSTGWRLGLCMIAKKNRFNLLLKALPKSEVKKLHERYEIATMEPEKLSFMERLVLDSRQVAEAHVGGLSTPQQVLMGLFMFYDLNDRRNKAGKYRKNIKNVLKTRITNLYNELETDPKIEATSTDYYSLLNIIDITRNIYGEEAAEYIKNKYNYLDFLFHLASKYETKLLPGKGFGTINWITRVSLANLRADSYKLIGQNIRKTIHDMVNDNVIKK